MQLIGRGIDAEVFRVYTADGTAKAMKLTRLDSVSPQGSRQRILSEHRFLQSLSHPGIIAVEELVRLDDRVGYLMELGASDATAIPPSMVRPMIEMVSKTLRWLHAAGLTHGDLSLKNIVCIHEPNGRLRFVLTDPRPTRNLRCTVRDRLADIEALGWITSAA
jgi:serine/threonine protein kinase